MDQQQQASEMDAVFQGVDFVRLRSGRAYVHAAEDGRSVCLDTRRASHNAVWAVTRSLSPTTALHCVLLRGAYGRYLGAPDANATARGCGYLCPCSSTCRAAAQRDFDKPEILAILWRVVPTSREGVFRLQDASGRYLRRANPRCLLPCRSGVSVSTRRGLGRAMQWVVESVPRGARPPDLPIPRDPLFARVCPPLSRLCVRCFSLEREIRFVIADDSVVLSEAKWIPTRYTGRRTARLKRQLVDPLPPQLIRPQFTLCIRAGLYGEPTPLAINLPCSRERLDIVLFPYSVSVVDEFIYPDVNAVAGAAAPARNGPIP